MKQRALLATAGLVGALITVVVVLIVSTVSVNAPEEAPAEVVSPTAETGDRTGGDCTSP